MKQYFLASTICAAFLLAGCMPPAGMASANAAQENGIATPCGDLPRDAVMKVPEPLANDMQIVCAKAGHVLMPAPGLGWRTSQGMLGLPAINPNNPTMTGPSAYFTKLTVHRPQADDKRKLLQALAAAQVPEGFYKAAEIRVLEIEASTGLRKRIYYFTTSAKGNTPPRRWGLQCYDQCVPLSGALSFDVVAGR